MNAGDRIGPWIIDAEIGRGAMGTVGRARHADTGQVAAVKRLIPELARDQMFVQRFRREIEALGQLDHPNIVRFLEAGEGDGTFYYAMEFVDGKDCEAILRDRGRLDATEVLAIARQVVAALKHAHDRGIIHRDLKPANLMIANRDAAVKLTDFGVAKLFARPPITAAGSFVGTAAYLAPELATGKPATKRSDFYSLGGVLYALLCGRPPFPGDNVVELLHKQCHAMPDRPRRLVPEIPHDVDDLVMQLLEKDPTRRPADGSALLRQIDRITSRIERKAVQAAPVPADEMPTVEDAILPSSGRTAVPAGFEGKGPATIAADLMRQELVELNKGGPLQRLFNHPVTLVAMFATCVGLIAWGVWRPRPTAESLYAQARPLMESTRSHDWEIAWRDFLEPLERKFPGNAYSQEVTAFRRRMLDEAQLDRTLERIAADSPKSEAERFYRNGLSQLMAGDATMARRTWTALAAAFAGSPADARWVDLARHGLVQLDQPSPQRGDALAAAVERVKALRAAGKADEAARIVAALDVLYKDDPVAAPVLTALKHPGR